MALSKKLSPLFQQQLVHQHPAVQAGVLCDLVALWLAGHFIEDSVAETRRLRAELLTDFLITIERLVPICAADIGTPHDPIMAVQEDDPYQQRQ
jgi:hypothetical protein